MHSFAQNTKGGKEKSEKNEIGISSLFFCRNSIIEEEEEGPKAKEVFVQADQAAAAPPWPSLRPSPASSDKKFDLDRVEVWILLASIIGAVLALVAFQLCKLCKIRLLSLSSGAKSSENNICHVETQKMFDSVIQEGLSTVSRTEKIVVMKVHLVPCHHFYPNNHLQPQNQHKVPTELTPNGAIMMQAKTCRQNLIRNHDVH